MGIVFGTAAGVGADAVVDVIADGVAEDAADSCADAIADTVADDVTDEVADATAEEITNEAVDSVVEKVAQQGASAIVQQVVECTMLVLLFKTLIEKTIEIVEDEKTGHEIKALLTAMKTGMHDAKTNLKLWNKKIYDANQAGKLNRTTSTKFGTLKTCLLFSAGMNADVAKFLTKLQPGMVKIKVAAQAKPKNLTNITTAVKKAQSAYITYANAYLKTLKLWNSTTYIKSHAGIDFQINQFETNLNNVSNIKLD